MAGVGGWGHHPNCWTRNGSVRPPECGLGSASLREINPTKTRVFCFGQMKDTIWDRIFLHPSFYGVSLWDGLLLADYRQTDWGFWSFWATQNLETSCPVAIHARHVSEMIVCDSMQHAGAMFRVEKCFSTKSAHLQLIWRKSSPRNVRLWRIKNLHDPFTQRTGDRFGGAASNWDLMG